jgi:hypothetical protein
MLSDEELQRTGPHQINSDRVAAKREPQRQLHELYDEMELWEWNIVQHNRWVRALKASNQVKVRPMWYIEDTEQEGKQLSWATTTRSLWRLKARIVKVGGKREQPKEQTWKLADAAQWELLFRGEEVFWKTARGGPRHRPHCLASRGG